MESVNETTPDAIVMRGDTTPPQFPLTKNKKHSQLERLSLLEWLLGSMPLDGEDAEMNFRLAFDQWWKDAADVEQEPESAGPGLFVFAPPNNDLCSSNEPSSLTLTNLPLATVTVPGSGAFQHQ
jgi:hypothetical protein